MTTAVITALAPSMDADAPAALLAFEEGTILGRLARQFRDAGIRDAVVLTKPEWATACKQAIEDAGVDGEVREARDLAEAMTELASIAARRHGTLVLAQGEIVVHSAAITGLLSDPRIESGILAGRLRHEDGSAVRTERGRVASADSPYHAAGRPTQRFLGVLKVSASHLPALEEAAGALTSILAGPLPSLWEAEFQRKIQEVWSVSFFRQAGPAVLAAEAAARLEDLPDWFPPTERLHKRAHELFRRRVVHTAAAARMDVASLLLVALVRSDVTLRPFSLRDLFWARPLSQDAANDVRAALKLTDEDAVLLRAAVKGADGFFTTFFVSPYSRYIARWAARRGFTPNQVTVVSLLLGVLAAASFALGNRVGLIAGAILLQVSFTADCVDGQLARYTRQFSGMGAWLDSIFDRTKEYVVFAGLAYGGVRGGDETIWALAIAALSLQTVRHLLDFSFATTRHERIASAKRIPLLQPWDSAQHAAALRQARAGVDLHQAENTDDERRAPSGLRGVLRRIASLGVAASARSERAGWMKYVKRIVVFPIGERFAVISLAAAISGPRAVFLVVLAWGGFAALYAGTGRVFRSLT